MSNNNNNNNNKIKPANYIAVVALAALGVLTFFGALFLSEDGLPGNAAIKAAAFTFAIGLLLVLCIVAKTQECEFTKWRIVEWICFVAYLVVAVACYKPFLQFFHIVQHRESLQAQAQQEINYIDSLCVTFNKNAADDLEKAAKQMKNYKGSGQDDPNIDGGLSEYIENHKITNFKKWKEDYSELVEFKQGSLDSLKLKINLWRLMDMSSIAYEMKDKASSTWDLLDTHIKDLEKTYELIPIISGGGANSPYKFGGMAEYNIGERPASSQFSQDFRKPLDGFNTGILAYILLHFLALANYFLVRRSPIVDIKKDITKDDSGLPIEI